MNFVSSLLRAYWGCGPLVIGTAALSFSFTALVIKFIGDSVPPFETVSASGVMCLCALTLILWGSGLPPLPKGLRSSPLPIAANARDSDSSELPPPVSLARVTVLTLLRAIFGSVATTAFILSLELLSLKDAVTLFFTSPVIALLLDWLLMGRSPGCGGAAATSLTLAGALLVTQPPFLFGGSLAAHHPPGSLLGGVRSDGDDDSGLSSSGVALALLAAVANASGFMAISMLRGSQHPLVLTWWYNLVLAVATAVPLALRWPLAPLLPTRHEALLLLAVGSTQLVAQLCLNRGFQLESAGRGAAINVLQVLFSFILDVAVLGDKPSPLSVGGSSLVAAGVLFVAMSNEKRGGGGGGGGGGEGEREGGRGGGEGGEEAAKPSAGGGIGNGGGSGTAHCVVVHATAADGAGAYSDPRVATGSVREPLLAGAEPVDD